MSHHDLECRADIERLVDRFYDGIRDDDTLGPIFNDVAGVDWAVHLPKMYAFWDGVLFAASDFKGNPLMVHRLLARRTAMTRGHFDRWLAIFHATVDELFTGPRADAAKKRASRIAEVMLHHIDMDRAGLGDVAAGMR